MEKPPLKKPGPVPAPPPPFVADILENTVLGGYEVKGNYDRKGITAVRRALKYHGDRVGVRFSIKQTQAGGLWIERMAQGNDVAVDNGASD